MATDRKIRCVLAVDHLLLREGLLRLLQDESDIEVVSEVGTGGDALQAISDQGPDVVIVDPEVFALPRDETEKLIRQNSDTQVLFLGVRKDNTGEREERPSEISFDARRISARQFVEIVRKAYQTKSVRDDLALRQLAEVEAADATKPKGRPITVRERQVLKLLAEGRTVRAAAAILKLSAKTVDAHKFNLMRKLGIHNKAELVMWAIQKRVVKVPTNS